jgi:hypothetical protein
MPFRLWIYLSALLISTIIGVVNFKKLTTPFRLLSILLAYTLIHECAVRIGASYKISLNVVYQIYILVAFSLYALIYYFSLIKPLRKSVALVISVIILALGTVNILTSIDNFPSIAISFCSCMIIFLSLLQLNELLYSDPEKKLIHKPLFWMNTAIMVYWSINFLQLGLYSYFVKANTPNPITQNIHTYSSIVYYAILGFCLYFSNRRN